MKKFLSVLAILTLLCSPAFAALNRSTIIETTLLDDNPTSVSGTCDIRSAKRTGFFVNYDETEVGNSISAAVTVFISVDNTNWQAASFYDFAGGATLQTSETISADGRYFFWLDRNIAAPYVKVTITGTNTDADDTAAVTCTLWMET